ncbi:MAG: translation initiation factor IF-2 N-terminal domain-containing protein, partial [Acidobacteriota bacterium]|nr:translation initiation factor IF-2 N-terminal domain-containing protein [Acidobacteriota bacterium]
MATVRIYKVAELLGTSSQEVVTLLKQNHGIEVKSASSTIEEVVARQFVERQARQRGITLPTGDIFADTATARTKRGAKKPAEVAKPAIQHALPPPRLVKTAKAAPTPVEEAPAETFVEEGEPVVAEAPAVEMAEAPAAPVEAEAPEELAPPVEAAEATVEAPVVEAGPAETVEEEPESAPAPAAPRQGRVVPPQLRLRVEEGGPRPSRPLTPRITAPPRPLPRRP